MPINIIFFKDGVYLENFLILDDKPTTVQNYFNHIYDANVDTVTSNFHATWWGTYKIQGDTIIALFFFIGSLNAGWFGREEWYKILDNQTIKSIYANPIGGDVSVEQLQEFWCNRDRFTTGKLVPLEKIPSSDCWLKKGKWFWCDENQWLDYMKANGYKIRRKDRK